MDRCAVRFAAQVFLIIVCCLPQYCQAFLGSQEGSRRAIDPAMKELIRVEKQKIAIEREKLEIQKEVDRQKYIVDIKAEDERLQEEALLKKDGRCADYFDSTRCSRPATHEGFCAKHYREMAKNVKDERYKVLAAQRIGVRKVKKGEDNNPHTLGFSI